MGVLNAAKQIRPTVLYAGLALFTFMVLGVAIYKISTCKGKKKGPGYALIVLTAVGAAGIALFNGALFFKESGAQEKVQAMALQRGAGNFNAVVKNAGGTVVA